MKKKIIGEKIKQFMKERGLTQVEIASLTGINQSSISDMINGKRDALKLAESLSSKYDFSLDWFVGNSQNEKNNIEKGIPFYSEIPVSAGQKDLMDVKSNENAVGFINITGVVGKYAFPVIGCSMEPVIHAGDIIVVDELNRWDKIDPDKIYLILTHDDRMIKHIEIDEQNHDILWCVSPNYKRFSISKNEVLSIYRVTFYGRLV